MHIWDFLPELAGIWTRGADFLRSGLHVRQGDGFDCLFTWFKGTFQDKFFAHGSELISQPTEVTAPDCLLVCIPRRASGRGRSI